MKTNLIALIISFGFSLQAGAEILFANPTAVPVEVQKAIEASITSRCVSFASAMEVSTEHGTRMTQDLDLMQTYKMRISISYRHDQNAFDTAEVVVNAYNFPQFGVVGVESLETTQALCK